MPVEKGIIGKKLGMTQIFIPANGNIIPVTVIEAGPCAVVQKKTSENDGYSAVQLGFIDFTEKRERKVIKPLKGHFKKAGVSAKRHLKEFKLKNADELKVGDKILADVFKEGEKIDVTGRTKDLLIYSSLRLKQYPFFRNLNCPPAWKSQLKYKILNFYFNGANKNTKLLSLRI
jgi:hypothetical protein